MTLEPTRRSLLAVAACAGVAALAMPAWVAPVWAADSEPQPFTQAAFEAAQKADKPILIDVYATWCDVCARQAPTLAKLRSEPKFKDLVILKVNFDTQKDVMRRFGARLQSTLICFHGTKEIGRSVGETQPEWIDDLLEKTLGGATT